jgi:hypothetical protein
LPPWSLSRWGRRHPRNLRRKQSAPRRRCRPSRHWNDTGRPIGFRATGRQPLG